MKTNQPKQKTKIGKILSYTGKRILKPLGKGLLKVADNHLIGGFFQNVTEDTTVKDANNNFVYRSKYTELDIKKFARIFLFVSLPTLTLISYLVGWITDEQLNTVIDKFSSLWTSLLL